MSKAPGLAARVASYAAADEAALAEALDETRAAVDATRAATDDTRAAADAAAGELTSRLAAGQIIAVQRILARENWRRLIEGHTAAQVHPEAVAAANHAFDLIESGLAARYG